MAEMQTFNTVLRSALWRQDLKTPHLCKLSEINNRIISFAWPNVKRIFLKEFNNTSE